MRRKGVGTTAFDTAWDVVKKETAKCTECGKKITKGYLDQAAGWFCSDKCFNKYAPGFIDSQEHKDAFESGDTVWTTVE